MKLLLLILSLILVSYANAQQIFTRTFQFTSPTMGVGYLNGKMVYSWTDKQYHVQYTKLAYSVLFQFNSLYGVMPNPPVDDPFQNQWRFKMGAGCPGGCESGRLTNSMPRLWLDKTFYTQVSTTPDASVNNCIRYKPTNAAQTSGVTDIWFNANGNCCKVSYNDNSFYVFDDAVSTTLDKSLFVSPPGCTCNNPIDIALSLDRSGSISFSQWNDMYKFLQTFGTSFQWASDKANLAIVNFNTAAFGKYSWDSTNKRSVYSPSPYLAITGNGDAIRNSLKSLSCCNQYDGPEDDWNSCCDGWTSISSGLRAAADELKKSTRTGVTKIIVLLTDGKQNTPFGKSGGTCYKSNNDTIDCCKYGVGSDCPDNIYGPGKYPGAQYLYCVGDLNYDGIVDDYQINQAGKLPDWPCGRTDCTQSNCGCPNVATCCSPANNNCNGTSCTKQPSLRKNRMKVCHEDLINAREYAYSLLTDKLIIFAVGVGEAEGKELEIITNNRYRRPATVTTVSVPITWTPVYNVADRKNPERVMQVTGFDKLAALLLELTVKICDIPAVPCGSCCGFCICGQCQPPDNCANKDFCNRGVLQNSCCSLKPYVCPPQNCKNVVCNGTACNYTPRPCIPAESVCYNRYCDPADNYCKQTPKWSAPKDKCHLSYCDLTTGKEILVDNAPVSCTYLDNLCVKYSCDVATGNCTGKNVDIPETGDKCSWYTCDPTVKDAGAGTPGAQFKKNFVTCTPLNNCYTVKCNPLTGGCEQTLRTCNDPNNLCDKTQCDKNLPPGACPSKNFTYCEPKLSTDQCKVNGTCVPETGTCSYDQVTCISSDCRTKTCNKANGECEFSSQESCAGICETATCGALSNECWVYKCDLNSTKFAVNCDIVEEIGKARCNFSATNYCIKNETCLNATGCYHDEVVCGDPENKCNKYVKDTTNPDCCVEVPNIICPVDPCNNYTCEPTTGICIPTPICKIEVTTCQNFTCVDGKCEVFDFAVADACPHIPCTVVNKCDSVGGCQTTPLNCDDKNACTIDSCNATLDACVHINITCNDNNPCTVDSCDSMIGCVFEQVDRAKLCDDQNMCTVDTCDDKEGCKHVPVNGTDVCNDNNQCTIDSCSYDLNKCVYEVVVCNETDSDCEEVRCKPWFGCAPYSIQCYLAKNGSAMKYNTSNDDELELLMRIEEPVQEVLTRIDQIKAELEKYKQEREEYKQQQDEESDCSYAVCSNSTCQKVEIACAGIYDTALILGASIGGGVLAGIIIAACIAAAMAGGGAYYAWQQSAVGSAGNVVTNPMYKDAGAAVDNPMFTPNS